MYLLGRPTQNTFCCYNVQGAMELSWSCKIHSDISMLIPP